MNKEGLIRYIQKNDKFYHFANMSGYTVEQLLEVKKRIDSEREPNKKKPSGKKSPKP
jgi:hypothetical protein